MKKVFCIILTFLLLFSGVFTCVVYADGDLVVEKGVPALPDSVNSNMQVSKLTDEQRQAIIDKALDWYFPNLVGYAKTCATATLSAALKLYEQKKDGDINGLQYFLKSAALSMRSLAASSGTYSYTQWRSAGDTLLSLNSVLAESGVVDGVVDWDKFSSESSLTAVRRFIDPDSGK